MRIKGISVFSALMMLLAGEAKMSFAAQSNQAAICARQSTGMTSDSDTGYYSTFLDLSNQHKLADTYTVFYHGLMDDLSKVADLQCSSGKPNQDVISSLDGECHSYCNKQGPPFVKSLGWFQGGHLVSECNDVCAQRTSANKKNFPATSQSISGGYNQGTGGTTVSPAH
jgi:hypothetical protein